MNLSGDWALPKNPDGRRTLYQEVSDPSRTVCACKMQALEPPGPAVTVGEFAQRWLAGLTVRPQTQDTYRNSVLRRINPILGHRQIAKITPFEIEQTIKQWLSIYAVSTVLVTLSHLSALFGAAIRAEVITRNPVSRARRPAAEPQGFHLFTAAELDRIIRAASERATTRILAALAATGMRKGEAVALDCVDFDRAAGTLHIHKTVTGRHGIGQPKSRRGVRTIRVPTSALSAVALAAGARRSGSLFTQASGRAFTVGAVDWAWRRLLKRLGLAYRGVHQCRHSCASVMLAAGASLADCAQYLGDSEPMLLKAYTHPTGNDPSRVMDLVLNGKREAKRGG